ncbi:MAG: MFS transporter [Ilumatobacteraceae bacterium]
MPVSVAVTSDEREALQRRVLRVLTASQIVGSGAVTTAVTIGAFVVQDLLGEQTAWAGIATASSTACGAVFSQALARLMARRGRRPGLLLGYLIAAVGGIIATIGVEHRSLVVFLCGVGLFGGGQASNLLARYAATDLAPPAHHGRAMSRVIFASAFGAILGPLLVRPAEAAGTSWFGLAKYSGPWLFGSALFVIAAVGLAVLLRPDPLVVAGALADHPVRRRSMRLRASMGVVRASVDARLGVTAMAISQATMVGVMTMTPVHMKLHGHESASLYVISVHIAGMYAFSPLVGRFVDRVGQRRGISIGAVLLVGATVLAAMSGDVEQLLFPALWLLGLAWSFGLISGSTMLQRTVPPGTVVSVQGTADLVMIASGALAGLASGFIRRAAGYHVLATAAAVAAVFLLHQSLQSRPAVPIAETPVAHEVSLAPTAAVTPALVGAGEGPE